MNRGEVLTAYFRDKQSQSSIRMEFVIIMILFDVMEYRSLYIVRYRSIRVRRKYKHDSQDFLRSSSVDVFGAKARMDTYRI